MSALFVVFLKYTVPLEKVTEYRPAHLDFLDRYYAEKVFIASGRQNPPSGGIILARSENREALEAILAEDPFSIHHIAEYEVIEWDVSKCAESFKVFL